MDIDHLNITNLITNESTNIVILPYSSIPMYKEGYVDDIGDYNQHENDLKLENEHPLLNIQRNRSKDKPFQNI